MLAWTEILTEDSSKHSQNSETPLHYAAAVIGNSVVLRVYDPERSKRSYSLTSVHFPNQTAAETWLDQNKSSEQQAFEGRLPA